MKITIDIKTENAAFEEEFGDGNELDTILKETAEKISGGKRDGSIQDSNGNTVGKFKVTGK